MATKKCTKCGALSKFGLQLTSVDSDQEYIVCTNCVPDAFAALYNSLPKDIRDNWVKSYFNLEPAPVTPPAGVVPMHPLGL